ncbi:MAG: cryptochrome/photolyase family protein [Patescibacteria group bacterium]|nr:cryptochrome/photolyase family protein [Patescibacteria group bacterium]
MPSAVIFPHQLYSPHPALAHVQQVFLIEDPLFFGDTRYPLKFHRAKLVYHRASMKAFEEELKAAGHRVRYVTYRELQGTPEYLARLIATNNLTQIHVVDPTDYVLEKRIRAAIKTTNTRLYWYESPNFLTSPRLLDECMATARDTYRLTRFYIWQRKRMNILVTANDTPVGGKWSFDTENRKPLPAGTVIPNLHVWQGATLDEARKYVRREFPDAYGANGVWLYPTTRADAWAAFERFLEERLVGFGPYEDAIAAKHPVLFHSVLTPTLNTGLLDPLAIVTRTLAFGERNKSTVSQPGGLSPANNRLARVYAFGIPYPWRSGKNRKLLE